MTTVQPEQTRKSNDQAIQAHTSQQQDTLQRRDAPTLQQPDASIGPFSLMQRLSEDVERLFGSLGYPTPWRFWSDEMAQNTPWPRLDVSQDGGKWVVQADLPGMKRDDIEVELRDKELCISGERQSEIQKEDHGSFRSERAYGKFCRTIRLPEGAKPDTAIASFDDGVLRIELDSPQTAGSRGRRIDVQSKTT